MLDNLKNNSNKFAKYFGLIVLSAFATTACSFNVSTATLEDVKTCKSLSRRISSMRLKEQR